MQERRMQKGNLTNSLISPLSSKSTNPTLYKKVMAMKKYYFTNLFVKKMPF